MTLLPRLPLFLAAALLTACGGAAPTPPSPPPVEIAPAPATVQAGPAVEAPTTGERKPAPEKTAGPGIKALPNSPIHFEGGDGSSQEAAIVILGAHGESDGVDSEYQYLDLLYGRRPQGWTMVQQSLLGGDKGKSFDALAIKRGGKEQTIYFDITDYFGK